MIVNNDKQKIITNEQSYQSTHATLSEKQQSDI